MRLMLTVLLLSGFISACFCQNIENVKASFQDGKVTVVYDLNGGKPNQKYSLQLYGSQNNFISPLALVTGDVGPNITAGKEKKIVWNAQAELNEFKGIITFRVKGELIPFAFFFKNPVEGSSVRRGKKAMIQWEGGKPDQSVRFELYMGSERVTAFAETKNTGQYAWDVPKDMGKGSYTMKLNAGQESVKSGVFTVKSKIPLGVKVLPILAIGGILAAVSGGGGSKGKQQTTSSDLPVAPGPK